MINLKKGFTLAEVLITLVVIGVLAALTIPALLNWTNSLEQKTALQKANSVLASALKLSASENGGTIIDSFADVSDFKNKLSQNLSILKDCNDAGLGTCWPSTTSYLDKSTDAVTAWITFTGGTDPSIILNDGSFVHFDFTNGDPDCQSDWAGESLVSDVCLVMMVDVNGQRGPNTLGGDIFRFFAKGNGTLVPFGASSTNAMYDPATDCTATGTGSGCTASYILGN